MEIYVNVWKSYVNYPFAWQLAQGHREVLGLGVVDFAYHRWSSTTSMFSSTTSSLRSWASSSASSLLSFSAAPAQGDGPDHYRPDSPDDFRVACRDVSMPLPEERSSEASSS